MRARVAAVAVAATFLVLAGARVASAHADLASSDPAEGAVLLTAPSQVVLTFTEAADPKLSSIQIQGPGGTPVATGPVAAQGPETLSVSMPAGLPNGTYAVSWRSVSTDDGHVEAGTFSYSVGSPSPPGASAASTEKGGGPTLLSVFAKVLLYLGLMLFVAVVVVWFATFREPASQARGAVIVATIAALAGAIMLLVAEARSVGVSIGELLRSSTGRPFLWLLVAVVATDLLAAAWLARPRNPGLLVAIGIGAAVSMWEHVLGGHASATGTPWVQETLQTVHFLAAGIWVGGLVLLAILLRPDGTAPVTQAERFSTLAVAAVSVLVLTGLLRALDSLGGLGRLADVAGTSYGVTLLVKVGLAALLIAAGAVNRRRTVPQLEHDPRRLRRIVTGEVVVAAAIVVLTASLTGLNPPAAAATTPVSTTSPAADGLPAITITTTTYPDGVQIQTYVDPATAGPNQVHVTAFAADGTALEVVRPAIVATPLEGAVQPLELLTAGTGHFVANVDLKPGTWRFDVTCVASTGGGTLRSTVEREIGD